MRSFLRVQDDVSVKLVFIRLAPHVSHIIQTHSVPRIMEDVQFMLTAWIMVMANGFMKLFYKNNQL